MLGLSHHNEIGDSVIAPVPVDMVNNLPLGELSSKVLLHDVAVFKDAPTVNGDFEIPVRNDGSLAMRSDLGEFGISESLEPLVMHDAVAESFVDSVTSWERTSEVGFPLVGSLSCKGASILPHSLEVHGTHIPTAGRSGTSSDFAKSLCQGAPPCDRLYLAIALNARGDHRDNWVNSGNTLTGNAEGNPERSRRYTFGTCRDYRRG